MAKRLKTVATDAKEVLEKKKRAIAVRAVDIFGNDTRAVVEVENGMGFLKTMSRIVEKRKTKSKYSQTGPSTNMDANGRF